MKLQTIQIPMQEPSPIPKLAYTIEEAAESLNMGKSMAIALINAGRLRSIRLGRKILIPVTEIQAFLDREISATPEV